MKYYTERSSLYEKYLKLEEFLEKEGIVLELVCQGGATPCIGIRTEAGRAYITEEVSMYTVSPVYELPRVSDEFYLVHNENEF